MKKIVIDRSKWRCGGGVFDDELGETGMCNERGLMCCLGQRCAIEGEPLRSLRLQGYPSYEIEQKPEWMEYEWSDDWFGSVTEKMANTNDNPSLTQSDREAQLIELAKEVGEEWEFVGVLPQDEGKASRKT